MKRTTAIVLLFALLLTSHLSFAGYASPAESEPITESSQESETPPATGENPADPELVEPPVPTEPPFTEPPFTEPPFTEPPFTEPPFTEPPFTEPPFTEPPFTEPGPSDETLLFEALAAVIDAGEPALEFSVVEELPLGLLRSVCTRALELTPRFFYLGAIDLSITPLSEPDEAGNLYVYRMIPQYRFAPGEELDAAKAYVENEAAQIIAKIPAYASDLEKLLFLHDYLCTHFAYDGTHTVGDLYRLLQNGHGVCQAYVYLYAYLLDQIAIPNTFAISREMNHIWNMVELDGEWYHIDLTWDDPAVDQAGRALHTNFLRSDRGMAETGHYDWSAPYLCTSELYENSFLPDLTGAILFTAHGVYGLSAGKRMLMELDFESLVAEPVADLSELRWNVWNKPGSIWKEQYINLYSDGHLIYFNGPTTIWSFDPEQAKLELLHTFHSETGYLYSLRGNGHTLTCTVSTAPGTANEEISFTTPHIYAADNDLLISTHTCVICAHTEAYLSPLDGDFFTACLSTRESGEEAHDLRLILLVDRKMLALSPLLTVRLVLHSTAGERSVTTTLSAQEHGLFLVYDRIHAGGREYAIADGYEMLGLIVRNLENGSYDSVTVTVTAEEDELYRSALSTELLFPSPEDPPLTEELPLTEEPPLTGEPPLTDEFPLTEGFPLTGEPPLSEEVPDSDVPTIL